MRLLFRILRLCWASALLAPAFAADPGDLLPVELRCDSAVDPLGIDSEPPLLSWQLSSQVRGARQTAWQVLVASTAEELARDRGNVWDSGKVKSDEQIGVAYGGRRLRSSERVFWKVRTWDGADRPSAWSSTAMWTMGLLTPADWRAKWITHPAQLTHSRAHLGYHSEETTAPGTTKWLQLDLGASQPIEEVRLHALRHTVQERKGFPTRFKVEIADEPEFHQPRSFADFTSKAAHPGASDHVLRATSMAGRYVRITAPQLRVSAGGIAALAFSQVQVISGGKNIAGAAKVTASDSLEQGPWSAASVVDGREHVSTDPDMHRTYVLGREFKPRSTVRRAVLTVCGLGAHAISVNGRPASRDVLGPGWTNPAKTCLYETCDVTALLIRDVNEVAITVAGGMYRVPPAAGRYAKFTSALRPLMAIAQLRLEYANGSVDLIGTDETWRVAAGPTTYAHIFAGEEHDARLERAPLEWQPAVAAPPPGGQLRGASHAAPPIRAHETLSPVAIKRIQSGVMVFDLGQNASLMPRLRVQGVAGSAVKITPAELLREDGAVDRGSVGAPPAWWLYTLAGTAKTEIWSPRFFYHGARYLQVELTAPAGSPLPQIISLDGAVVHSAAAPVGQLLCSDELFSRIRLLVRWAQRSNLVSVITDCPHRERLGWLEQYHLNGPALRYEFDLGRLYRKTFGDMRDAQTSSGLVPDIAPEYVVFSDGFRDSPEWGSAIVLAAWQQYLWTGDASALRLNYDAMKRYVAYLASRATDHILSHGLGDWYDIGPKPPGVSQLTPLAVTATAIYYEDVSALAAIARLLGRADDAARFIRDAAAIKAAFNRSFYNEALGRYATGSQTSHALPLVVGLVDDANRPRVLEALVADIRSRGNAITAGDVGYRYVLRALADGDRSDVIFDLNHQSEKPGYGYQLAHGATSLTEAWNSDRRSSQNHFMLGQIMEWFYHDLAGIQPSPRAPGFKEIVIKPAIVGDLTWVSGRYVSERGPVLSEWRVENGKLNLTVTIPPNATATVFMPATRVEDVTESRQPVGQAPGVKVLRHEANRAVFAIGSGTYRFAVSHEARSPRL